ncbi:hypothetical protein ANANG_G00164130 [Anguilla anguilla]|uniref:Uncharacterized protein n=1 Tax=Anguilla anguilla TaxID=7936 RepID=A0A9D3M8T6_ANGAN|nr:hypothetical protein ANANG_G00164130 [Anguilla anguilla]
MLSGKTDSSILQSPPTLGREFLAGWPVTTAGRKKHGRREDTVRARPKSETQCVHRCPFLFIKNRCQLLAGP